MARQRPAPPFQRHKPRDTRREKDPLGEELGDYREDLEDQSYLPDSWYALTDEQRQLQKPYRDYNTTSDSLELSEGIDAVVDRAIDWEERYWDNSIFRNEGTFPNRPKQPPGDPLDPLTTQETESVSEAFQATDKIDADLGHEDREVGKTHHSMINGRILQIQTPHGLRYQQDGRRMHPCEALENDGFDINMRKHVRTGNGKRRLAQIRRQYAYMNCR